MNPSHSFRRRVAQLLVLAIAFSSGLAPAQAAPISIASFSKRPKLVLVLSIDQFRADYLTRFKSRFLPATGAGGEVGGFNYLMSRGAYFPFARYDLLQSMTGPGHATILSGAYPYQMGIGLNYWWEADRGEVYCTGDDESPIVGGQSDKKLQGMSPRNFRGDTVGDVLKNSGYPARVVSVALKDRSAILMGGHRADLALWFDNKGFGWVSSKHYLPDGKLPAWVARLNSDISAQKGKDYSFKWSGKGTGLSLPNDKTERSVKIGSKESLAFPYGVEVTATAAVSALESVGLGKGPATDILAVSISSHDYVSHQLGPNSREMEEMTAFEDKQIARLLNAVRKQVPGGLSDVVIALTADHGAPPSPAWLKTVKMPSDYVSEAKLENDMESRLTEKFGKVDDKEGWIVYYNDFNFYLNPKALSERKTKPAEAEAEAKAALLANPATAHVFTKSEFQARKLPAGMFERQILKTFTVARSGDIVMIPRPYFINDNDPVGHQTSYAYDSSVPLIIAGSRLKPGVYSEKAEVIDLASTLSFLLGIVPPAVSEGRVLSEALTDAK